MGVPRANLFACALTALVVVGATPAVAATIFADDFETEALGLNTALDNWTVSDGAIDVVGTGFFESLCAGGPSPARCVDLDGSISNAGRIETNTAFALAPGTYELSFWLSGSQRGDTNTLRVALGSLFEESFTLASTDPWTQYTRVINVAGATTASLVFDHAGGDNLGILLDNVNLEGTQNGVPVPEPGSLSLLALGLSAGLIGARRRSS